MDLSSESEPDHALHLFFTSLSTIKEITYFLGTDDIEHSSASFLQILNRRCATICSLAIPRTAILKAERGIIVRKLLVRFDSMFDIPLDLFLVPATEVSPFTPLQNLRALNEVWASYDEDEKPRQLIIDGLRFGSAEEQLELLADLRRCEAVFMFEPSENHTPFFEIRKFRSEPSHASLFAARSLFHALETSGRCSCHTYGARLCIKTHRDSDLTEKYDFDLFLEIDQRWQEARFLAAGKSPSTTRPVADDGCGADKKDALIATRRMKVEFLCDTIKKLWENFPTYRLNFLVENDVLWKLQSKPSDVAAGTTTRAITFQRFMAEESFNLTERSKRILAVLLGYAVLHLLGTPWLHSSWGPSNIVFHKTPSGIPLKPYIELQFGKDVEISAANLTSDNDDAGDEDVDPDDFISHPYPQLVSLAGMLIELHLTRGLQVIAQSHNVDFDNDMNECTKYAATVKIFNICQNDISEAACEAIKQCLDRNIGVGHDRKSLDARALRREFYRKVVSRLEYDLEHTFNHISIETLDVEAQKLDLAEWSQPTILTKLVSDPREDDRPLELRVREPLRGQKRKHQDLEQSALMTLDCVGDSQFFDDQTAPSDISFIARDAYIAWKSNYDSVYRKMIGEDPSTAPVRIAVLDTGLDRSHPDLEAQEGRIKGTRSFISDCLETVDVFDYCGQGTHVAGLLLDFAPNAELYIAKISDLEPAKPAKIAEAITHAVDVWNVDVISMSFGFPTREIDDYDLLERSIRRAVNKDVLLFAAASNNGANTNRAYPARYPDVICIHSTNANGAPSDFNPRPVLGHNLATIGEAVESTWPVHLCDQEKNALCVERKSSTSFATPIASGIAAFLLQYARLNLLPREAEQLKQCHYMKAVLKAVSVNSQGYDYIAPSPHPDNAFGKGEDSLNVRIRDAMKEV